MSANVSIGYIQVGSASNAVGIFSGQNMQNSWDSHSPLMSAMGGLAGSHSMKTCQYVIMLSQSVLGQATFDNDSKLNGTKLWVGP